MFIMRILDWIALYRPHQTASPFFLLAGPNVIESEEHILRMAKHIKSVTSKYVISANFSVGFCVLCLFLVLIIYTMWAIQFILDLDCYTDICQLQQINEVNSSFNLHTPKWFGIPHMLLSACNFSHDKQNNFYIKKKLKGAVGSRYGFVSVGI